MSVDVCACLFPVWEILGWLKRSAGFAFLLLFPDAVFKSRSWKICVLLSYSLLYGVNDENEPLGANFILVFRWHVVSPVKRKGHGKGFIATLINAFHILPFTAAYQYIHPRPPSASRVAEQLVLLSDNNNVFHHQPYCTATGMCSESFPCIPRCTFLCPWCAATALQTAAELMLGKTC